MGPKMVKNDFVQILLPSAVHLEERLTVSKSVRLAAKQSVRQKHTVWVFCPWQTWPQPVWRAAQASSGRTVMQLTVDLLFGGSNPGRARTAAAPPKTHLDSNRRRETLQSAALPFDRRLM